MLKYFKLAIFVFVFFLATSSNSEDVSSQVSVNCKFLPEHLYSCDKFECQSSVEERGTTNIVSQKIIGLDDKGLCINEQVTQGGEKIVCHYENESRKFMSIKMQDAKTGKLGKDEDDIEYSEALMGEIFYNECEVFDKNGNKVDLSELEENAVEQQDLDFKSIARKVKKDDDKGAVTKQ